MTSLAHDGRLMLQLEGRRRLEKELQLRADDEQRGWRERIVVDGVCCVRASFQYCCCCRTLLSLLLAFHPGCAATNQMSLVSVFLLCLVLVTARGGGCQKGKSGSPHARPAHLVGFLTEEKIYLLFSFSLFSSSALFQPYPKCSPRSFS